LLVGFLFDDHVLLAVAANHCKLMTSAFDGFVFFSPS